MAETTEGLPVETRGLTKIFRDFWLRPRVTAVDGLDMTVQPHEVYGLLGPNGSGKSTAIKIILGLLFPTRGRLHVLGRQPTDVATKKRIGYLPEESYLYPFLNARETLDYYGRLFHIERRQRQQRIDMLLEMVGLDAVQRRPVQEYSKGMQRRIGLAQALINDPDLLILDEPTTGLDPIGTRQIKDLIRELKNRGKTVLLSSHLLADVEDVCDRVSILYGGRKRAEGPVDELLRMQDVTVIETDPLSEETISEIEHLIERRDGQGIRRAEAPRQRLEQLFLSIVEQARAQGAATSGVTSGGQLPEFLVREAHLPESGREVIHNLVQAGRESTQEEGSAETEEAGQPTDQGTETSVIDQLTGSDTSKGAAEERREGEGSTGESAPSQGEQADQRVIDELVERDDAR